MANLEIIKIKLRRGSFEDRSQVLFEGGELGYISDYDSRRLIIGNGITVGGFSPVPKFYSGNISLFNNTFAKAITGDLIYNQGDTSLYVITGANFTDPTDYYNISPKTDGLSMTAVSFGQLTVRTSGISAQKIHSSVFNQNDGFKRTPAGVHQVNFDNESIKLNTLKQLYADPRDIRWQDLPRSYPGPGLMWIDELADNTVRIGPKPLPVFINFNVSWNTCGRTVTAFLPGETIGNNANDRPRINTFRTDTTFITYASAGFVVWDPVTKLFYQPWGDRTVGAINQTIPLTSPTLSAGVDIFVPTAWPTPTLSPPITEWRVITNPLIPEEVQYQYLVNFYNSTVQNISVSFC